MMNKFAISLLTCCTLGSPAFADWVGRHETRTVEVKNQQLRVRERHDLTSAEKASARPGPPGGYLQALDQATGKLLFTVASPPLTHLWISPDSQFIVGLSDVKLDNPYQLAIYNRQGRLFCIKHITPEEARLSSAEFAAYRKQFPQAARTSNPWTTRSGAIVYVDYDRMNAPVELGNAAWKYLWDHRHPSHYSANFSESVTNSVYWYSTDPKPELTVRAGRPVSLSLLDPKGERFSTPLP